MEQNLTQAIFQINCIQLIISEFITIFSKLNKKSFTKENLIKILLKIIYQNSSVVDSSFSFLLRTNAYNILVSWDKITENFDVDISTVSEPGNNVIDFVQNYIQSQLADKADFDKLSVLFNIIQNFELKNITFGDVLFGNRGILNSKAQPTPPPTPQPSREQQLYMVTKKIENIEKNTGQTVEDIMMDVTNYLIEYNYTLTPPRA